MSGAVILGPSWALPGGGLNAGTSYRYQVLATNNSGATQGLDQPFATPAETCVTAPSRSQAAEVPQGLQKKTVHGKPKCVKVKEVPQAP
jgi:hypothetical protein